MSITIYIFGYRFLTTGESTEGFLDISGLLRHFIPRNDAPFVGDDTIINSAKSPEQIKI